MQSFLNFLGRALIGGVFVFASMQMILNWQASEEVLHRTLSAWQSPAASEAPPAAPLATEPGSASPLSSPLKMSHFHQVMDWSLAHTSLLLLLACLCGLIGGIFVFLGMLTRFGAFLLLCLLVPCTFMLHAFWDEQGTQRQVEMANFVKNLGLMGGLLFMIARGSSEASSGRSDPSKESVGP